MNDDELETTLRRYRPSAPVASLRARVQSAAAPKLVPLTSFDWALVAAAFAAILAAVATELDLPQVAASAAEMAWEAQVEEVAVSIGGGDDAVRYARAIVPRPPLTIAGPREEE